jgi:phenylalanyl-tRNA synthetase beta chain
VNASYEWLRAFVPLDATPAQLRDLITLHTATVDELVSLRTDLAPIVVGKVVEAGHHPDSDHLWVTKVDAGGGELLEVVCGAPNVTVGSLYPFAPVGTTMPNGMKLDRRKIRGIVSNGMLCSARELGLGEDHQGILELKTSAAPGTPFLSVMPVGDTRLVIDVGANRADLQSHIGLARELAAISGKKWQLPELPGLPAAVPAAKTTSGKGTTAEFTVSVDENTRTRRYMGAIIKGVKIAPSPEWLVRRLDAVGVRAINNVVDATNYVLHELGQPIHAFDAAKLAGKTVVVRKAKPGEKLTTLDGTERALPADSVVIADGKQAQAVAGVMGGRDSEITNDSRDLFIEVASFDPKLTRAARKALGMSTDASYRFERGVDPDIGPVALDRVVRLIQSLAGGQLVGTPADVSTPKAARPEITLRSKRVVQILGIDVPLMKAAEYLERAGFEITARKPDALTVRVPSWRTDVVGEVDLVEEVARFHGYDKVPSEIRPFRPSSTFDDPQWTLSNRVRETMVGLGFLEIRPMPFVAGNDDTHVRVANPLAENEAHLRDSLLETLSKRAEFNLAQRNGDVRVFEIGSTFTRGKGAMPREQLRLGAVLMGRRRPAHFTEPQPPVFDEWDAKGVAEVAANVVANGPTTFEAGDGHVLWQIRSDERVLGNVVRLALDAPIWAAPAFAIELVLGEVETEAPAARGKHTYIEVPKGSHKVVSKYRAIPTMPPAEFDLALLVPTGTTVADVERVIRESAGELLERLDLFDQYTGAGVDDAHRSLAWRLTFRHAERTLRDKEIEGRRNKILSALQQELHVRQRTG